MPIFIHEKRDRLSPLSEPRSNTCASPNLDQFVLHWLAHILRCTTCPPKTVITTCAWAISIGSTAKMSRSRTIRHLSIEQPERWTQSNTQAVLASRAVHIRGLASSCHLPPHCMEAYLFLWCRARLAGSSTSTSPLKILSRPTLGSRPRCFRSLHIWHCSGQPPKRVSSGSTYLEITPS